MNSRSQLAYNAEERCRQLSVDALGNIGNRSDSQTIGSVENLGYYT